MVSNSLSIALQHDFSRQYILTAAMFARKCAAIEKGDYTLAFPFSLS